MTVKTSRPPQSIPGYEMLERLGSGGYGDVWKALAPGQIEKAIKVIYGQYDDDRAAREMKALNRIKEVRHPFLLSLERIEVVGSQLVIVTELADMSLKDRFLACREAGGVGIPRDELLVYLRDAADALDHMSEHCALQHLDIKPQNLLLVGGRVKVADFGLVHSIDDTSLSLMGGLTPIYAPPELFEGQPGLRSDQYSLAIVYQEMLTGKLPFSGTSASQLMAQHLQHRPRLTSLPPGDRATVARALSKAAEDRFSSCRAMVDCLATVTTAGSARRVTMQRVGGAETGAAAASAPVNNTLVVTPSSATSGAASCALATRHADAAKVPESVALPSITCSRQEVGYRPTLFLGVGGTATRVLRHLRQRLHRRFGSLAAVPAMQTLLLDTDLQAILRATQGDRTAALAPSETVAMPLRSSNEYQATAAKYLRWLSRRWLYNIPRSRRPDGRRPLGRVALMDHGEVVSDRIKQALVACTDPEALEKSAATTRHPFVATAPRVFIVASTAGGTGGGMALDLAYAVRALLLEMEFSDEGVCGILLHSSGRDTETRDLALANSYACLAELHHYSHPSLGYPGAPECGIPAFDGSERTFPHAYFVDLGDHLSEAQFDLATKDVAEYIYIDAATPAGTLLDKCRAVTALDRTSTASTSWLRSFGLCRLGGYERAIQDTMIDSLCRDLARRWQGELEAAHTDQSDSTGDHGQSEARCAQPDRPSTDDLKAEVVTRAEASGLQLAPVRAAVTAVFEGYFGGDFKAYGQRRIADLLSQPPAPGKDEEIAAELIRSIHSILGPLAAAPASAAEAPTAGAPLDRGMHGDLDRYAARIGQDLCSWLFALADRPNLRAAAAAEAADCLAAHLRRLEAEIDQSLAAVRARLHNVASKIIDPKMHCKPRRWQPWRSHSAAEWSLAVDTHLVEYLDEKFQERVLCSAGAAIRAVAARVAEASEVLAALRRELAALTGELEFGGPEAAPADDSMPARRHVTGETSRVGGQRQVESQVPADDVAERVVQQLPLRWSDLLERLEERFDRDELATAGGLVRALSAGSDFRGTVAETLRHAAREVITQFVKELNVADVMVSAEASSEDLNEQIEGWLAQATPRLCEGGCRRLLALLRDGTDVTTLAPMLRRANQQECSIASGDDADVVFCYEVEQLPMARVAHYLTAQHPEIEEIAKRLHTRVDIAWTPLGPN